MVGTVRIEGLALKGGVCKLVKIKKTLHLKVAKTKSHVEDLDICC